MLVLVFVRNTEQVPAPWQFHSQMNRRGWFLSLIDPTWLLLYS